ncbi:metal ABC transporter permease, partial [Streptococcus suis]
SIALRICKIFIAVIFTGMGIVFFGMVMGLLSSYYAETPASASITLILISIFLLVNVFQKFKK